MCLAQANPVVAKATAPTLAEIEQFQRDVVIPFLGQSKLPSKMQSERWMGLRRGGLTFADLSNEDAAELIQLVGPSAFKVVRFSHDLLARLRDAQAKGLPIISSGGSCLLTAADKNHWKNSPLTNEELRRSIGALPNLMQIFDASLPLTCANQYVNIIEDSLFVELAQECSTPRLSESELAELLRHEGQQHSAQFAKLNGLFNCTAEVRSAHFADLPVKQHSDLFWQRPEVFAFLRHHRIMPFAGNLNAQFQVLFSFTGVWAEMLRTLGFIAQDSCYLVVEPFHHFTEAAEKDERCEKFSDRWHTYAAFDELMTAHVYGQPGVNLGVQGAIAFLPILAPKGQLGHTNLQLHECCSALNLNAYLSSRAEVLQATKIPSPDECLLFVDGLNYLYHQENCRAALTTLMQQTLQMREEAGKASHKERKEKLKALRSDPQNLALARAAYETLLAELTKLCQTFFSAT